MHKTYNGYCSCYSENRSIAIEYLRIPPSHNNVAAYKKDQFYVCSDCPLSNVRGSDDICPIYASAPVIVQ